MPVSSAPWQGLRIPPASGAPNAGREFLAAGVEFSDLNWLAILIAIVSNVIIGFVWYAKQVPTGRIWMREMKIPADAKPTGKQMAKSLTLMLIGTFLLMFVFQHVFLAFRDAYRLDGERLVDGLTMVDGLSGGFFTWLGFFLPVTLGTVAWEGKSWSLFFVNTSYHLVTLLIAGAIFALMM